MTSYSELPPDQLRPLLPAHLAQKIAPDIKPADIVKIVKRIRSVRNVLSTYLPRYLVEEIELDPTPGRVSGDFREGTVLFADVSGFTAMSRKMSALGKEGAEEITGIVNNYFTKMLDISSSFGGDLLKFGGDALLIYFEGKSGALRSLAAGNAMQIAMRHFSALETSQGVFPLRMKIGIACGSIFMANLGTPEDMDYAILGNTLAEMAQAESIANPEQIVVSNRVRQATGSLVDFDPAGDRNWRVKAFNLPDDLYDDLKVDTVSNQQSTACETPSQIEDCLRDVKIIAGLSPYVPEELLSWIITDPARLSLYSSHRPVTVMFANFYGIGDFIDGVGRAYPDTITRILNTHYIAMSEVNFRYGGTINRLDTYTKGNRFLIVFGALRAHEDDPQRAVRTALEMNHRLAGVNHQIEDILNEVPELRKISDSLKIKQRIGVNSGFVFAGNTGSGTRREYTVMGDQVNLTARMMGIAQGGEVLIGQSTARQLGDHFNLMEKNRALVKGIQEPVRNFLVQGIRESSRGKTIQGTGLIAGRDDEIRLANKVVDNILQGKGGVLVIRGVSGIGKTRLSEEIISYGKSKNIEVLFGNCLSYGKMMTYHPWVEILQSFFDIQAEDHSSGTMNRIEAIQRQMDLINEGLWTPVIGTVMGLGVPDNDITREMDPKLRRQRVLDLTLKLLETRAQRQPLMLVIEDTHWADPASLDLIDYICRNIANQPVMLVLPQRPDEGLPEWSTYPHTLILELGDLTRDASMEIINDLLGDAQLPDAIYDTILAKGGGNPFFIAEVLRALIDSGAFRRDSEGVWQVSKELSEVEIPDTIHGVILSRIDRLLATHRLILQVASVIGRIFDYPTLDGVYPYADEGRSLRQHLETLNDLRLTELQAIEREIYRFIHLTTREVVYDSLSFEHRRSMHREIGDFIERTSMDSVSEQISLLAYHYYEGQAWGKAMEHNLAVTRHAQREFANEIAILSGQRALEAATNLGPDVDTRRVRIDAHETLGEVLTLVGRYDEAFKHCNLARNILEAPPHLPDQPRQMAEICRKIAAVHERQSEYENAFEWLDRGLAYLEGDEVSIEAVRIYLLGVGIYRRQGLNEEAAEWCQKSVQIASQIKTREGQQATAQAYYNLGGIEYRRGDMESAAAYCRQSLEIYHQIDDIAGQARAYTNLGAAYSDLGDWGRAVDAYNTSLTINQRIGDVQRQGFLANNLANVHLNRGELDQAASLFHQSNAIWKKIGSPLPDAVTLSNLAQVHISQENWKEAQSCLSHSEAIFEDIGSDVYIPELERRWGELLLRTGHYDQAVEHLNRSIELAIEQNNKLEWGMSLRVLGEVFLVENDYHAAKVTLDQSLEILKSINSDYEAAKVILSLTRLGLRSNMEIDRVQLQQAVSTFQMLEAQRDLAEALEYLDQIGTKPRSINGKSGG
jgi:class 3 adenylate cyclase/tetratricopeptide (TPR) repeat protein